ncbi:hypothetical protein scyTo_0005410 [Scyliorhinus torazame]|uniref:Uncharacterized protein n=1 Tax=Scyliorhinus torazame TaxID=75743 RepID=A0A401P7E3_SCYTO|nr:hypothetical protein [Scyliorhinus torazame]
MENDGQSSPVAIATHRLKDKQDRSGYANSSPLSLTPWKVRKMTYVVCVFLPLAKNNSVLTFCLWKITLRQIGNQEEWKATAQKVLMSFDHHVRTGADTNHISVTKGKKIILRPRSGTLLTDIIDIAKFLQSASVEDVYKLEKCHIAEN